jgi:ribosomal protein S18 acetylase RimI-like enzyme
MKLISDKNLLYRHFAKDPVLFAYHIGDLDDFYFKHCQWPALVDNNGEVKETVLIYGGLSTPTVMFFGVTEEYKLLIKKIIDDLPDKFFCHFLNNYREILIKHFREEPLGTHYKMKLTKLNNIETVKVENNIIRLGKKHQNELTALFDIAYPDNYFDEKMLDTSKYLGYISNDELVGVSGVHTCSDQYNIAVLGNITVHPKHRGRKIGTILTAKLTEELANEGKTIVLNVHSQNRPAIGSYQNIGFEIIREYEESIFTRV